VLLVVIFRLLAFGRPPYSLTRPILFVLLPVRVGETRSIYPFVEATSNCFENRCGSGLPEVQIDHQCLVKSYLLERINTRALLGNRSNLQRLDNLLSSSTFDLWLRESFSLCMMVCISSSRLDISSLSFVIELLSASYIASISRFCLRASRLSFSNASNRSSFSCKRSSSFPCSCNASSNLDCRT
jgi:hypothetical protein